MQLNINDNKTIVFNLETRVEREWSPSVLSLTTMPSTRGMTMLNLPMALWSLTRNKPILRRLMTIRGMSFSRSPDLGR